MEEQQIAEVTPLRAMRRRRKTRDEALASRSVRLIDIATIAGVTKNAVCKWRSNYLDEKAAAKAEGRPPIYDDNCLLAAANATDDWDGDTWNVPDVIGWLRDTYRMKPGSFETQRKPGAGRKPGSGRAVDGLQDAA